MFEELMPALVTPFDEDGEIDLQATEAIVERHIEAGVDGISAGEHGRVLPPHQPGAPTVR